MKFKLLCALLILFLASSLLLHSADTEPPTILAVAPAPGSVTNLTEITVQFSEIVGGVDAADLLINGVPALTADGLADIYTFTFERPSPNGGTVLISWSPANGITDEALNAFDGAAPSAQWSYIVPDIAGPTIATVSPTPGAVSDLTEITVHFSETVRGVDAKDLLINGVPATTASGSGDTYTFTFARPSLNGGVVVVTWSATNGITDLASNEFDGFSASAQKVYFVPDIQSPVVADLRPENNVRPLNQIRVTFSESVTNVDAADFLVNGKPATNVIKRSASVYTFQFTPARLGASQIEWRSDHGITDLSPARNGFAPEIHRFFDTKYYSIVLSPGNNTAFITFSNTYYEGVSTVEGKSGHKWIPLENFFTTQRVGQVTMTLPAGYTELRLVSTSIEPGNPFSRLANSYGNIHTVAGRGELPPGTNGWRPSYEGARATDVNLSNPRAAVADAAGNIYVAEKDGHAIVMIDPQGFLHTVLGTHVAGSTFVDNGAYETPGTNSPLRTPTGLWMNERFLYVLDAGNARVREFNTVDQTVRTILTDPGLITKGGGLWVNEDVSEAFYTDGTKLKRWQADVGLPETIPATFVDLADVNLNPSGQTIVADRGDNRIYRVRNNGEKIPLAGTGLPKGLSSGGNRSRVALPGASSIWFMPVKGYLVGLEEGARIWYVDNDKSAAPLVFGLPGVHQGDEEWFRAHARRPKIGNVHSVSLAPSGDMIIVEGSGFVRTIDFLRHRP